ncbi:FliM/FliN family flagellar motor switch protein [Buchnera aphidicola]|nr:FliM/FliN family flagellar motor switch protein [Buchnera aphidicola]
MQMGKSNNLYNEFNNNKRKNNLKNFLTEYEIKLLKTINNCFIDQCTKFFSNFIKSSVRLVSCNMHIGSFNFDKKIIQNLRSLNLIEILPYKKQCFVIFPHNFLSFIIDILFGGQGFFSNTTKKITDITSTESLINIKIIKFITNSFTKIYKKYFSPEINFINTKTFYDIKKSNFDSNTVFLINYFSFQINNVEFFFNILIPISILKHINKNIVCSTSDNHANINLEENIVNRVSLNDIYDVKLNIISKIIGISISHDKISNLSIGDILSIQKPNKIVGFIEDQEVFLGNYKRFNEQSIVFIEEFIHSNIEFNQDKECFNE